VNQEGGLLLVRFDQGDLQLGTRDLEGDPRKASAGADVHHFSGVPEMLDQHEAVLDQRQVRPSRKPGPPGDHLCELNQLRIVHEMPIYEYRCESCSEKFDVLTRFAERDQAQMCPACESTKTRVLVSSFAFAGTGDSQSLDFGGGESAGGGCCGGSCGSCGSSPN
jgi:putative FmdB family regulatory protein